MKILFHPASGRWGRTQVAFQSKYGMALREYCVPHDGHLPAQERMRQVFGRNSQAWGPKLSQAQRDRWNFAASQVMSHPRCAQAGVLSGAQFFTGVNSVLGCVGSPPVWEPPARVLFPLIQVRGLVATNDENGVRLFLELASTPTEDIMVFGQAPCSAGRAKRRNVSYLGLLTPGQDGKSEITAMYKAKFGEPPPGTKVFIVTCQQKNGWKGLDHESSEIVPARPEGLQASPSVVTSSIPHMHQGCTRGAEGVYALPTPESQASIKAETPGEEAATADIGDCGVADKPSGAPG
jgi:hypothetical protein